MNPGSPAAPPFWRLAPVLAVALAVFSACVDQTPTRPTVARCAAGVATNSGACVPALSPGAMAPATRDVIPATTAGAFTTYDNPDASWTGSTTLIDISGLTNFTAYGSVSDANLTVTFGSAMSKLQAAVAGGGWATWSCPPYAETCTPHVLWGAGATSNTLTFSKPVFAFGFEIEPDPFQIEPISVNFVLMAGNTVVGVINRSVNGNAGARLIAGRSTVAFDNIQITSGTDFAIGQLRYSLNTETATQLVPAGQAAVVTVVENNQSVAGINVPAGTFAQDVTLTVQFLSTTGITALSAVSQCHAYLLAQTGKCLAITAIQSDGSHAVLQQPVTVGICLEAVSHVEIFKFENTQDRPVALRQVPAAFLPCDGALHQASAAPRNWLDGFAQRVAKIVGPKPLYAAHLGFGGDITSPGTLSIFTWAAPLPVTKAGLVVNPFNLGKDAFALAGTFSLPPTGFDAANDVVIVGIGKSVYTIPAGSFHWVASIQSFVFASRNATGVTAMAINPAGTFTVAATVPTEGPAPTGTSTIFRPFSVQIGSRAQGVGLKCGATAVCSPQETP